MTPIKRISDLLPLEDHTPVTGLAIDSRKVQPGYIFFCLEGFQSDGHLYAEKAAEKGALLIVHSKPLPALPGLLYYQCADVSGELNRISELYYGGPSRQMTIFGITGTNGKTTIANILRSLYSHKIPTGYIGTIGMDYLDVHRPTALTTPDQIELQADLREMLQAGVGAAAIEISSHGLVQRRAENIDVDCAIFTNFTRDHLDYHGSMEAYFEAKKLLFSGMKREGVAILNANDESIHALRACCPCPVLSYGIGAGIQADYQALDPVFSPRFTDFTLVHQGKRYPVRSNLVADYNLSNLLAAIAAAHSQGMELEAILPLCSRLPQVPGRMETVDAGQDFHVIVDYAHTPDAFEKVFAFAEQVRHPKGRIIAVFGSAGGRDKGKRGLLGEIAGRHCTQIIATTDDPRSEDPAEIGAVILKGAAKSGCPGLFIEDRAEAIGQAIREAQKEDIILLLGIGHQHYLMRAGEYREPYAGDVALAQNAIGHRL